MKHLKNISFGLLVALLFSSCHTALVGVNTIQPIQCVQSKANMEFIGFKNARRNDVLLKDFGAELERNNIALNRQGFYMGVYSLQELETYKSTMRYLSFIDVVSQSYSKNDAIKDNDGLAIGGWLIAGLTCFALFPVYVPMMCCADANECLITLKGDYQLYVYDTKEKKIVLTQPITVEQSDRYKGQFTHKETDQEEVNKHYRTILYNALLENYAHAYDFVRNLNE